MLALVPEAGPARSESREGWTGCILPMDGLVDAMLAALAEVGTQVRVAGSNVVLERSGQLGLL